MTDKTYRLTKILTFEATHKGQSKMDTEVNKLTNEGWKEINRVSSTGKYKKNTGCALFFLFAPLALFAGHENDKVIVTLEKFVTKEEYEKVELDKKIDYRPLVAICLSVFIMPIITFFPLVGYLLALALIWLYPSVKGEKFFINRFPNFRKHKIRIVLSIFMFFVLLMFNSSQDEIWDTSYNSSPNEVVTTAQ